MYKDNQGSKKLEKRVVTMVPKEEKENSVSEAVLKRENLVIYLLINEYSKCYEKIKNLITLNYIQDDTNKQILKKMYEEFEKGNSNINSILDNLSDEEQNHITAILADDYEINNIEKAIDDIMQSYEKDKLNERKFQILEMLETPIEENQKKELEKELSEIIIHLAKIK